MACSPTVWLKAGIIKTAPQKQLKGTECKPCQTYAQTETNSTTEGYNKWEGPIYSQEPHGSSKAWLQYKVK